MADYQVIDDPNDPRLADTPLNDEFDPNTYGAQSAPAQVVPLFDPAAYAEGKEKKVEQPKAAPSGTPVPNPQDLPYVKASRQTFYYPSTPEDTRAQGLSYSMEGGIHGAGKFSDLDLRNHTMEKFIEGTSPWVAVAMKGVPTGQLFRTEATLPNGQTLPIIANNVDTGGGLKDGQQDIATSTPQLAKTGGSGFDPAAYAGEKVPDINAFMEPAPADTSEAEAKDEPTPAEIAGGAISKAASKFGAALSNRPMPQFKESQSQLTQIPQVPQQQMQVIPGQGMIGAAIPMSPLDQARTGQIGYEANALTAGTEPTKASEALRANIQPMLEHPIDSFTGMFTNWDDIKRLYKNPEDILGPRAKRALGMPVSPEEEVGSQNFYNTGAGAAMVAPGVPHISEGAGAIARPVVRSLTGANMLPRAQESGAIGATGGGKRTYKTPSGEVTIQGGEVAVPASWQPKGLPVKAASVQGLKNPPRQPQPVETGPYSGVNLKERSKGWVTAFKVGDKIIADPSARIHAQMIDQIPEGVNAIPGWQDKQGNFHSKESLGKPNTVAPPPPTPPTQPPQGPPPQNPPPGGGVPPRPPKSIPEVLRNRQIKDRVAAGKDSVFTRADYDARQKANGVRQDFGAQTTRSPNLKENVQANKDMEAATFIAEAQGNKVALAHDLEMVRNSKNPKLASKYEPILKYAMDNFTRISDQLSKSRYMKLMQDQLAEDVASGITYPEREGYVTHVLKSEPENAFVSFFTGKPGGGGLSRYFTKSREFNTLAEAINAGVDPASVNIADLAQHRIASSRRLILNKALFNELKNIQAPDGNPVLKGVFRHPDPPHGPIVPKGYELMNLNGVEVAVHPGYSGLFKSLYGDSALRRTKFGRGVMKTTGVMKSYTLAADTYHGFRGIKKGLFYGGKGSRLGFKRGVTVYELSDEGLDTAVKNNEITQKQADWAKSARPIVEEMMNNGLNVSKYADNLVGQMHVNFPGTGRLNDLIFNRVFRGAMIQASHANYLRNLSRFPELTKREVARRTAKEMNEVFGNMMSQGILKDKTLQDASNMILLSPQWVQSQVMAEFRGYGQQGRMISDAFQGKFRMGTVAQGQATAVLAYLVGNQIINYATTGHSTFENDGWTNKMSAFLPIGDRGVYLNPFALSAEYADRFLTIMDRQGEDSTVASVLAEMATSKLTGAAHSVVTLATQRDWRGRRLEGSDVYLEAGKNLVPVPIGVGNVGGSLITLNPNSSMGFDFEPQYDKITQSVLQAMGERGVLGDGAPMGPVNTERGVY